MDTLEINEVTLQMIVIWSALIGVAAFLAYWVYRSMEGPRLVLTPTADGPRAMPRDTVLYALTTPLLVLFWWTFFFSVLVFNDNEINAAQLVIFPIALIIAIRTLAFLAPRAAHELAKVVPVALIAFVILDGNIRPEAEIEEMLDQVSEIELAGTALLLLFVYDYVITAIWYWGWIRWGQPRWEARKEARSGEHVAHDDGRVAVLADTDGADRRT
ncbi:MAG: hypothetical protein RL347_1049 [Actinomycetota bacterium]